MNGFILFLLCFQCFGMVAIYRWNEVQLKERQLIVLTHGILLTLFFVAWGGYSLDAWRYLSRFTHNPWGFNEEWLFWFSGHTLSLLVPDPWPLKILTGAGLTFFLWSIIRRYGIARTKETLIAFLLLPLLPAVYLTLGNSIRQGIASVVVVHGIIWLVRGRKRYFVLIGLVAALIHQYSLLLTLAAALSNLPRRVLYGLVLVAPFISFMCYVILGWFDIDLDLYVPYSFKENGVFHYLKFFFAYIMVGILILIRHRSVGLDAETSCLINIYIVIVIFSALILKYEVSFERVLLYSEVLLPLIIPTLIISRTWTHFQTTVVWLAGLVVGLGLWTHNSILRSFGVIAHLSPGPDLARELINSF